MSNNSLIELLGQDALYRARDSITAARIFGPLTTLATILAVKNGLLVFYMPCLFLAVGMTFFVSYRASYLKTSPVLNIGFYLGTAIFLILRIIETAPA